MRELYFLWGIMFGFLFDRFSVLQMNKYFKEIINHEVTILYLFCITTGILNQYNGTEYQKVS